jgi:hypothetical protein
MKLGFLHGKQFSHRMVVGVMSYLFIYGLLNSGV